MTPDLKQFAKQAELIISIVDGALTDEQLALFRRNFLEVLNVAERYFEIEETWRREDATTLDMMRKLAEEIDGKEPPKRSKRV